jgi:hypothetical protein
MSENAGLVLLVLGLFLIVVMIIALLLAPTPSRATPESPLPPAQEAAEPDVFEQLEHLAQAGRIKAAEDAKHRRWLRPLGFITRLLSYAALFLLLYNWAPKDISKTPLGSLTLSDIGGTIFFVGIGIVLTRALFDPSDDDEIKDAWGWLGVVVVLLGVIIIGAMYRYSVR